jgi:hypothetical protein
LYQEAQFSCCVLGHIGGPYKPFVSKFVWPRLPESCVPSHLPHNPLANLAAANLSIAVPGVANLLFLTPQLQHGLAGQTWVSRTSPRCCRANGQGSAPRLTCCRLAQVRSSRVQNLVYDILASIIELPTMVTVLPGLPKLSIQEHDRGCPP